MSNYPVHTIDTAPEGAKQSLAGLQQAFGLVPNLAATMANSPPLVNSFVAAFSQFAGGTFTGGERQVLLLSNAVAKRVCVGGGVPLDDRAGRRGGPGRG